MSKLSATEMHICTECTGSDALKSYIDASAEEGRCSFHRTKRRNVVSVNDLAEFFRERFEEFYVRGSLMREFNGPNDDNGHLAEQGETPREIIEANLVTEPEIVDAVMVILQADNERERADGGDPIFDDDLKYEMRESFWSEDRFSYQAFKARAMHVARYVDPYTREYFERLFSDIAKPMWSGRRVPIREISPEVRIFRGRAAETKQEALNIFSNPLRELVAPPLSRCTAGRMNGAGIRRFYGTDGLQVVVGELRPAPGSFVVAAEFQPRRVLRFFDFTVFQDELDEPNLFDVQTSYDAYARWKFFEALHRDMTKSIVPTEAEINYLTTKIAAEYIDRVLEFDGLICRFSQVAEGVGLNIIIFNGMSAVRGDIHTAKEWPDHLEAPENNAFLGPEDEKLAREGELRQLEEEPLLELVAGTVRIIQIGISEYHWEEMANPTAAGS